MPFDHSAISNDVPFTQRRSLLKWTTVLAGASAGLGSASAQPGGAAQNPAPKPNRHATGGLRRGMFGFMLAHEQFPVPELVQLGALASRSGFDVLATSDHFQPWQANEPHCGQAWITLGALGAHATQSWMGTTVTCPTLRYNPAVVAQAFATLDRLYPGRVFLGIGSGEALNEQAATGQWPKWQERWDRLIEAITITRELWSGKQVSYKGTYYQVQAKLYDPPVHPIPIFTAANGKKSMRLTGQHGDGLVTDPLTWKQHKAEWEAGARDAGKNPAEMPVLVEHYVIVGDQAQARQAAELWRFGPKAFKAYFNIPDPAQIQQRAEAEVPLEQVMERWTIGTNPEKHVAAVQELFASGASIVNIHSGQPDQRKVIEFYASRVLPKFKQKA
jgi:TAT-translocated FGD2 family F420-dependent dehydrogenase